MCLINRAACYLHLNQAHAAIKDCDKILFRDPCCVKALYRRGAAKFTLKSDILEVSNGKGDLKLALSMQPNNKSIKAMFELVERELPRMEQELAESPVMLLFECAPACPPPAPHLPLP